MSSGFADIIPPEFWTPTSKDQVISFLRSLQVPAEGFAAIESAYKSWAKAMGVAITKDDIAKLTKP